jgi:c-di-AMP phosphodiesterase-like protein
MATGRVKKENGLPIGVVLVLSTKEANWLRGYLQNSFNEYETSQNSEMRKDIFYALPTESGRIYQKPEDDIELPF